MLPKFIKAFLISVVLILGALSIYNASLPDKASVLCSTTIENTKIGDVFEQVAIMRNRANWSPWSAKDSLMKSAFSGPAYGVGSIMSWEGNPEITGIGNIEITKMVLNESLELNLTFEGFPPTKIFWTFVSKGKDVEVNWSSENELSFMYRFFGPMIEENVSKDFTEGLVLLKEYCENKRDKYQIEMTQVAERNVYSSKSKTTADQIGNALGAAYQKVVIQMMAEKQVQLSQPFAIYHNWNGTEVELEAAIHVANLGHSTEDVTARTIAATTAIKGTHIGPYDATQGIYDALHKYMDATGLTQNGSPWEVYITDPSTEADASKWITEIYFPIK